MQCQREHCWSCVSSFRTRRVRRLPLHQRRDKRAAHTLLFRGSGHRTQCHVRAFQAHWPFRTCTEDTRMRCLSSTSSGECDANTHAATHTDRPAKKKKSYLFPLAHTLRAMWAPTSMGGIQLTSGSRSVRTEAIGPSAIRTTAASIVARSSQWALAAQVPPTQLVPPLERQSYTFTSFFFETFSFS
jgi:hypothetical protein